jgi:poly-gamma-glutamate system protein
LPCFHSILPYRNPAEIRNSDNMNNKYPLLTRFLRSAISIIMLAALLCPFTTYSQTPLPVSPHPDYELMVEAAMRMQAAERIIYEHKLLMGLVNTEQDFNRTGLVGIDTSTITTTFGSLTAKRSATNPDFAAYLVRLLKSKGVSSNDSVLVAMTGSLPGLNIAVIIAMDLLEIPNLRISSIGSSAYGANLPEMTWLDIEDILFREGVIQKRSEFVSLGGKSDIMLNIDSTGREEMRAKCFRLGYRLLESESIETQRALRVELIGDPRNFALMINIGGNSMMLGLRDENSYISCGWIDPEHSAWRELRTLEPKGIMFDFLEAGVPVLNLIHLEELCRESGIYDPRPLPRVGTSPVYFMEAMR